jgi:PadR family transcriptional regulator PadR
MHGYAATQWIAKHTKGSVTLKPGSLYPLLHSLEEKKFIRARWKESPSGPRKKIYAITKKGQKEIEKQKKDLQTFHRHIRGVLR